MTINYIFILLPLIVSNTLHMLIVKKDLFSFLSYTISEDFFGANKTWRGFILVPLLNAFCMGLLFLIYPKFSFSPVLLCGALLGFAYVLSELPNSYIKRKMGITAGTISEKNKLLFLFMDKTDSSLGVSLLAAYLFKFSFIQVLILLLLSISTHVFFSWYLVVIGVKKSF